MEWLLQASIQDLHAAYIRGDVSICDVLAFYLDRIESYDRAGPTINSVRKINPKAQAIAQSQDALRMQGAPLLPLTGVPILIKDNVFVAAGMSCAAGADVFKDFTPAYDATLVRNLKAAGAIILGKANMTEFADYVSETMPSRFSAAGGEVRHPYGLDYGRGGGSSIGPAAAVAAGFAHAAIGSETQNSIQAPAAHSAVMGFKPTVGRVSRHGIFPLVASQDTAGVLARSAADAAAIMAAMSGADVHDSLTLTSSAGPALTADIASLDLGKVSIGVARATYFDRSDQPDAFEAIERILGKAKTAGVRIVDNADIPTSKEVQDQRSCVFKTEFKASLNAFLSNNITTGEHAASLAEIIAHNERNPDAVPHGQGLLLAAEETSGDLRNPTYCEDRARDIAISRTHGLDAAFETHNIDAVLVPMANAAQLTGKAGYPVATLPLGSPKAALSLIGKPFDEARLLQIASTLETLAPPWSPAAL